MLSRFPMMNYRRTHALPFQRSGFTMNKKGFTLFELLIVIAIIAILSSIAVPNLMTWLPKHRMGLAAQDVLQGLNKARVCAVKHNRCVVVIFDLGTNSFTVFVDDGSGSADADNDGRPDNADNWIQDGNENTVVSEGMPPGVRITTATFGNATQMRFDNRGFPFDSGGQPNGGIVTLVNSRGEISQIQLLLTGMARIL